MAFLQDIIGTTSVTVRERPYRCINRVPGAKNRTLFGGCFVSVFFKFRGAARCGPLDE